MKLERVKLMDICEYESRRIKTDILTTANYISTENMQPNRKGVVHANSLPTVGLVTKFEKSQILISNIRPYFKKIWMAKFDGGCSNDILCFKLKDKDKVDSRYFYYLLSQDSFFDYVMSGSKGTKMPRGDRSQILNFEFDLPSIKEQERIAAILGALDDKIELNNIINKNLEEQASALFKHWFVDFEFPDANGKPYKSSGGAFKDSELGPIPSDWKVQKFGNYVIPKKGKNITRSDVKIGNIPVIAGGITPSCFHNKANTIAPVITVSASGANAGYVWLHNYPVWSSDSSYIDKSITDNVYFSYLFLKKNQSQITHKQQGCAQPHIYPSHLMELDFIYPFDDLIKQFNHYCESIFNQMRINKDENNCLAYLRDSLLPKLVSNDKVIR